MDEKHIRSMKKGETEREIDGDKREKNIVKTDKRTKLLYLLKY